MDPFEAAFEAQQDSPPESPPVLVNLASSSSSRGPFLEHHDYDSIDDNDNSNNININNLNHFSTPLSASTPSIATATVPRQSGKNKFDDEEDEDDNVDIELGKFASSRDPAKMVKMQEILSKFTEEQMSRYESFRRAGFQKANMKRLLASITGTQKISVPITIVVSGITKMFFGDLIETARVIMTERQESGPIRPCHLRESYRRLKVEGKAFKRSVPRLFR